MRTPARRVNPSTGEVYYRVRYLRGRRQRALTFYGDRAKTDAQEFAHLLNSLGPDRAVKWWNDNLERTQADQSMTLDEWFARYLKATTGLTDGTRVTYQRTYDRVWSKPLGSKPLTAITREDIAHIINELSAVRADKTVKNAYGILATALKVATADGHIPISPCANIRLPRRTEHTSTEMRFLTYDEWDRLYDALPTHYRPLFTFLIGTGVRWGEAEALTVSDVILGHVAIVRVNKAAKWNASKATRTVGPTKTRKSNRTITLPDEVVDEIRPLLDRPGHERLFVAPRGGPLRHRTVYDEWKRAIQDAGLTPQPRIHDLRHTHVAWLIAANVRGGLPVIQARLGHEQIATTIDRYGHLMPDLQIEAAAVAMLRPRALGRPEE